jgi:hypothetical protein
MSDVQKPKVLLTVLGPLSVDQMVLLADRFPESCIRQETSVFVEGQPRAVFEIIEAKVQPDEEVEA